MSPSDPKQPKNKSKKPAKLAGLPDANEESLLDSNDYHESDSEPTIDLRVDWEQGASTEARTSAFGESDGQNEDFEVPVSHSKFESADSPAFDEFFRPKPIHEINHLPVNDLDLDSDSDPDSELNSKKEELDEDDEVTQVLPEDSFQSLLEHWSAFSVFERRERFARLHRTEAEDLFLNLGARDQSELIAEISPLEKRSWIRMLAPDDIADLIQEMDLEAKDPVLDLLETQTRREVTALLAYAEDNAGGLMNSRFVRLRESMTVDEAISYIRIQSRTHVETIYYAYVVDAEQTLVGIVSFRELFASVPGKRIRDVMKTDLVKIPVGLDQEQVAKIFQQNNFMALPVIDEWGHIKGIVTFDDIASVMQEEATEDIQKLGGVEALDAPYMETPFFELVRKRVGWLMVLFFAQMFTATAMSFFKDEIERAVVLALFIPLIISSGGNSGSQASTLIIRAMALGEVRMKDWLRVLRRELAIGLVMGLLLGVVGALRILWWPHSEASYGPHFRVLAVTIAASLSGVVLWGTITGSMLPFLLKRLKLDPATASAPFVATLVDVTGIVIYFSLASLLLSGRLI